MPAKGRLNGKWNLFLVRRINDRSGMFAGPRTIEEANAHRATEIIALTLADYLSQ